VAGRRRQASIFQALNFHTISERFPHGAGPASQAELGLDRLPGHQLAAFGAGHVGRLGVGGVLSRLERLQFGEPLGGDERGDPAVSTVRPRGRMRLSLRTYVSTLVSDVRSTEQTLYS